MSGETFINSEQYKFGSYKPVAKRFSKIIDVYKSLKKKL